MPKNKKASEQPTNTASNSEKRKPFGNWTGKTAVTLLSEHCQRNKWQTPCYSIVSLDQIILIIIKRKHKGNMFCVVSIGKKDPKSGQVQKVTFVPKDYHDNELDAKHVNIIILINM